MQLRSAGADAQPDPPAERCLGRLPEHLLRPDVRVLGERRVELLYHGDHVRLRLHRVRLRSTGADTQPDAKPEPPAERCLAGADAKPDAQPDPPAACCLRGLSEHLLQPDVRVLGEQRVHLLYNGDHVRV